MDQKKAIVLGVGLVAVIGLFAVVFSQLFSGQDAPAPTALQQRAETPVAAAPIADPKTVEDVRAAIEMQLAEDEKALAAEVVAETADIEAEVGSISELSQSYDENEF